MAAIHVPSTTAGGLTPICNDCGIMLCWDISDEEYQEAMAFWEAWICQECNGGTPLSLKAWLEERDILVLSTLADIYLDQYDALCDQANALADQYARERHARAA
jgi:hypothetical protein